MRRICAKRQRRRAPTAIRGRQPTQNPIISRHLSPPASIWKLPSQDRNLKGYDVTEQSGLNRGRNLSRRLDKTKSPQVISQSFHMSEEMKVAETPYPAVHEAMQQQRFIPNRISMMCSRRNCSYWRHCEREWGGEVPES